MSAPLGYTELPHFYVFRPHAAGAPRTCARCSRPPEDPIHLLPGDTAARDRALELTVERGRRLKRVGAAA